MIAETASKLVAVTIPAAILDNASAVTIEVDTKGWEYATYYVMLGASDIAVAAMAVTESAVTASGHVNVTGAIFGTSVNTGGGVSTLPADDADGLIFAVELDLKARERFLDLTLTAGNGSLGTFFAAWCVLSRGKAAPTDAAGRGCSQILRVA